MAGPHTWWQTGVIYQIYPRSFMDSNGDGIGDLPGIAGRLDYPAEIGVDAIWLSPIFPSPMADFGYDVSDYTGIDPIFGSLADFDALLAAAHGRGLKLLLDLVPNHSSDEHRWFVESRARRDNPKRDWYIWRDPGPDGGPPNNWQSFFGGDAWSLDPATGQYYLHLFHAKQPDLNWRNPEVREAMYAAMRFWLDRGVDGFRVDVIWLLIKDDQFRDNPPNPAWQPGDSPSAREIRQYTEDQPEVHAIVREMRALLDSYTDRVLIGEIYLPVPKLISYYGEALDGAHLPFNFGLLETPWQAQAVRHAVDGYEAALPAGAWPNWVLGNHDRSRVASRIGSRQARVAQMLLLTLRGTPTCYYGDELGMHDVQVPHEHAHDPQEIQSPGYGRDPERTPMQWDDAPNGGFSSVAPWLPLAEDYREVNVAAQRDDPRSMLALFRRLTALRRAHPSLSVGSYRSLETGVAEVFAYVREAPGERLLIVLNFGDVPTIIAPVQAGGGGQLLCGTDPDRTGDIDTSWLELAASEGLVIQIT